MPNPAKIVAYSYMCRVVCLAVHFHRFFRFGLGIVDNRLDTVVPLRAVFKTIIMEQNIERLYFD